MARRLGSNPAKLLSVLVDLTMRLIPLYGLRTCDNLDNYEVPLWLNPLMLSGRSICCSGPRFQTRAASLLAATCIHFEALSRELSIYVK